MTEMHFEQIGSVGIIRLAGNLDAKGAASIYSETILVLEHELSDLVLDFGGISIVTEAGLRLIKVLAKLFHNKSTGRVRIVNVRPEIGGTLQKAIFEHTVQIEVELDRGRPRPARAVSSDTAAFN